MMYEVGTTWWRAETEIGTCAEENKGTIFQQIAAFVPPLSHGRLAGSV
jgi:hypothetical protein